MKTSNTQHIVFFFILSAIVLVVSHDSPSPRVQLVTHVEAVESPVQVTPQGRYEYLEITASCGPNFEGHCIPAYAGPGTQYEEVTDLRNGVLLKIKGNVMVQGQLWYRVYFDEWLRYADRVEGDWYIPAVAGRVVTGNGLEELDASASQITNKRIVVDISDHMLYAYEGSTLFMRTKISTGVDSAPTPVGTFTIYKKTPSRYMQGPLPGVSDVPFDLPGVPWNMYFTGDGAVIHGSYWHDRYGTNQSSGCINLPPELSKIVYDWAPLGTSVTVQR